ncbi:MAG TPA: zf-HC2 domain-containing protein [Thermoleophilaceae bacterium]|nr:zf-HC2 domain-containing protein [Thermoleophilaceae bacterium]
MARSTRRRWPRPSLISTTVPRRLWRRCCSVARAARSRRKSASARRSSRASWQLRATPCARPRRRSPGSGWCERAERLISDRLDGELRSREVLFLDVHLRNCPRCVEHERRLVQASDALLVRAGERPAVPVSSRSAATLAVVVERPPPELPSAQPPAPRAWHAAAAVTVGLLVAVVLLALSSVV